MQVIAAILAESRHLVIVEFFGGSELRASLSLTETGKEPCELGLCHALPDSHAKPLS